MKRERVLREESIGDLADDFSHARFDFADAEYLIEHGEAYRVVDILIEKTQKLVDVPKIIAYLLDQGEVGECVRLLSHPIRDVWDERVLLRLIREFGETHDAALSIIRNFEIGFRKMRGFSQKRLSSSIAIALAMQGHVDSVLGHLEYFDAMNTHYLRALFFRQVTLHGLLVATQSGSLRNLLSSKGNVMEEISILQERKLLEPFLQEVLHQEPIGLYGWDWDFETFCRIFRILQARGIKNSAEEYSKALRIIKRMAGIGINGGEEMRGICVKFFEIDKDAFFSFDELERYPFLMSALLPDTQAIV